MTSLANKWIFGSFQRDFLFLYLSAFVGYLALLFPGKPWVLPAIFALSSLAEIGHIYSTSWRVYFNPAERGRNWLYWGYPLAFFILFSSSLWYFRDIPYFIEINLVVNLYHFYRQNHGVNKWYQKINSENDRFFDYGLYFVMFMPTVLIISRSGRLPFLSVDGIEALHLFYYILVSVFFLRELYSCFYKKAKAYRLFILSLLFLVNGICLVTNDQKLALAQLALNHGVTYLFIMTLTMERIHFAPSKNFYFSLVIITLTSLLLYRSFDVIMLTVRNFVPIADADYLNIFIVLHNTVIFSHYFIDAHIWHRGHPDAKKIYAVADESKDQGRSW